MDRRSDPGACTGLGEQRTLQGREVAETHETRALVDRLRERLVPDVGQQPREAITAAADHGQIGATGSGPVDRGEPGGVIAGEAHVGRQCVCIDLHRMAQRLQAAHTAAKGGLVALRAGRRIDIDVAHGLAGWRTKRRLWVTGGAVKICQSRARDLFAMLLHKMPGLFEHQRRRTSADGVLQLRHHRPGPAPGPGPLRP
jgi:hypothetical protein